MKPWTIPNSAGEPSPRLSAWRRLELPRRGIARRWRFTGGVAPTGAHLPRATNSTPRTIPNASGPAAAATA